MIVYFYITPYDVSRLTKAQNPNLSTVDPIEYFTTHETGTIMVSLHADDFIYFNECGTLVDKTPIML